MPVATSVPRSFDRRIALAGDAAPEPHDLGLGDEPLADALTQVVHAQIDRAEMGEAPHDLGRRLVRVALGDGPHDRETAGDVEHGRDHPAVQASVQEVTDELGTHVEADAHPLALERLDAKAEKSR